MANPPRTYTVEAICAIPHPVPTHALASSSCLTHLLTGSDDGYLRDYDIFSAVNSKNFLTAPQRHHAGVVEGLMKSGQLRYWWENPALPEMRPTGVIAADEEPGLAPIYSLSMQSDALWALAGTDVSPLLAISSSLPIYVVGWIYQLVYSSPRTWHKDSRYERTSGPRIGSCT